MSRYLDMWQKVKELETVQEVDVHEALRND